MLIGIPCSGKSYYAEKEFKSKNIKIVSTDEIRIELTGNRKFDQGCNNAVFETSYSRIKEELLKGRDAVFDATNTNKKYRKKVIDLAKSCSSGITAIIFRTPLTVCIERNKKRPYESKIPEQKLYYFSRANLDLDCLEGFDEIKEVIYRGDIIG
jgi:Predicted kinase